jgi:hypothetical protein
MSDLRRLKGPTPVGLVHDARLPAPRKDRPRSQRDPNRASAAMNGPG